MADTAATEASVSNAAQLIANMRGPAEPAPPAAPTADAPPPAAEAQPEPEPEEIQEPANDDDDFNRYSAGDDDADAEPEAPKPDAEAAQADDQTSAPEPDADDGEAPTVDAPTAWDDAEKAEFAKMPAEAQRIVAEREAERETAFQGKTTELGEKTKLLDQAVELAQTQSLGLLNEAQGLMAQALEAAGYTEEPNWDHLRSTMDAADYFDVKAEWDATQQRLENFRKGAQEVATKAQQEAQQKFMGDVGQNNTRTAERYPEYADSKTRDAFNDGMFKFLEDKGIGRDQSKHLYVTEWIDVVQLAMKADALETAKPGIQKKVRTAPKMARPGAPRSKERSKVEGVRAALKQAGNSKNPADVAGVFAAFRQQ